MNAEKQKKYYDNPEEFANIIRSTFGNSDIQDPVADKIAELYVFSQLMNEKLEPQFGGFSSKSSIDIECPAFDVEVKSTTRHHDWIFHSNPEQLKTNLGRPLYLVFCRFEKTEIKENAWSIQKLCSILKEQGVDIDKIKGLPSDTSDRERIFKLTDVKVFEIDSTFPCPVLQESKGGVSLVSFELRLEPNVMGAVSLKDFFQSLKK